MALPGGLLVLGAVLVARVGERVAVVAVGVHLEQDRALARAAARGGARHGVAHGQHVHAVDDLGVHVVVGEAGGAAGEELDARDLARRRGRSCRSGCSRSRKMTGRPNGGPWPAWLVNWPMAAQFSDSSTTPLA